MNKMEAGRRAMKALGYENWKEYQEIHNGDILDMGRDEILRDVRDAILKAFYDGVNHTYTIQSKSWRE